MKLHILSDLHLEYRDFHVPQTDADVIILSGDVHSGTLGVQWAKNAFPNTPVLYINGNHEFYRHTIPTLIDNQKKIVSGTNVHVLENDIFEFDKICFFGCTLWTDFALNKNISLAIAAATMIMPDFRLIHYSPENRIIHAEDTILMHQKSVNWLKEQTDKSTKKKVVITHHLPLPQSIDPQYKSSRLNPAFASDLHSLIDAISPDVWIHGHTHQACNYFYNKTHIICNPRGYPHEAHTGFEEGLVICI